MRGLDSQQAAQAVAAAYVAAGLRADSSSAANARFDKQRDEWLADMNYFLEPDWWPMWPEAQQDMLLDDLERARAAYASISALVLPWDDEAPKIRFTSDTLGGMRTTFCRLAYLVHKIGQSPPPGEHPQQWRLATNKWFEAGVTTQISAWEFDDQDKRMRAQALREFSVPDMDKRHFPRLHRLIEDALEMRVARDEQRHAVQQRERKRVNADLEHFRREAPHANRDDELAALWRSFARNRGMEIPEHPPHGPAAGAGPAHSLAHRSYPRAELSERQQVVYGRGRVRY
ncbi:uncharacterized protein RHOBADRAFT_46333 [Rhodotorula graminis WP1]|uniref:Uncharacterized protein n=1 Tax=Rhodotorula graminis (strain WP1) TaxID=578459 RepID=A0A0P9ELV3_RHOGW|nr:uncharacterized protein RHOBADRAFT_46333 [Rhodotorula graminis WP1]KPV72738.1 hypothetical protein RHOBADRAFT_46333 [Rhodotorula graminis WP1]